MKATIEPGLPGTGPVPVHLHTGNPTSWTEGCVVRFRSDSGNEWIGNLQTGYGYATRIIEWNAANAIFVIARGAAYFIRPDHPESWICIDELGSDCNISPDEKIALLTTYTEIVAITMNGTELWRRDIAIDGVEVTQIEEALIYGRACMDPPDMWVPFILDLNTGLDVEASD
ncbi:hypothetical protein Mal35_00190 [Gimesia maris]|uniref:hypothetical protein n=1 Tax=Gimesia maris TaxID=122 RepID=UPI001187CAED|nr:hypothetical protein [Gimesia maris]QDT76600.1 hypothetical protein Mal35_00190 [Gimesia maris]